jgi:hypothetical protein
MSDHAPYSDSLHSIAEVYVANRQDKECDRDCYPKKVLHVRPPKITSLKTKTPLQSRRVADFGLYPLIRRHHQA